jgi:hypothetical protein
MDFLHINHHKSNIILVWFLLQKICLKQEEKFHLFFFNLKLVKFYKV